MYLTPYPSGVDIYVRQPTGYDDGTGRACTLNLTLYGLSRSALWWYGTISEALAKIGFIPMSRECLNYLSTITRPDITYTVNKLAKGNLGPSKIHLQILKHLWRYVPATKEFGITMGGASSANEVLSVYADASFADNLLTRFSTGGHVAMMGTSPIMWSSKTQTLVATSTTEAEFINLTPAGKTLLWLQYALHELRLEQTMPMVLFTDSANARTTVPNPLNAARTRHIDIRYKWIIDQVTKGQFEVHHIGTGKMIADGLTKPLCRPSGY